MRIAVIGTGISGGLAARLLSTQHDVTVFEANGYAGGHANTVDVAVGERRFAVDTGFMVFNRRTYPNFCRLLQLLEVASQPSDMSFSVRCVKSGLEYQGSSLNGLFSQRLTVCARRFCACFTISPASIAAATLLPRVVSWRPVRQSATSSVKAALARGS